MRPGPILALGLIAWVLWSSLAIYVLERVGAPAPTRTGAVDRPPVGTPLVLTLDGGIVRIQGEVADPNQRERLLAAVRARHPEALALEDRVRIRSDALTGLYLDRLLRWFPPVMAGIEQARIEVQDDRVRLYGRARDDGTRRAVVESLRTVLGPEWKLDERLVAVGPEPGAEAAGAEQEPRRAR